MAFLIYQADPLTDNHRHYHTPSGMMLAGNRNGLIYKACKHHFDGRELVPWTVTDTEMLTAIDKDPQKYALFSDVTPDREDEANVYRIKSVSGFTNERWTPIMISMETTLHEEVQRGTHVQRKQSFDDRSPIDKVVSFAYLHGGHSGGSWNFGRVGSVNGTLLWADALDWFISQRP